MGRHIYLTPQTPCSSLIWLHGLGDSADGFLDVFSTPELDPTLPTTRVVLITASDKPVTINGGMAMPSWYDILSMEGTSTGKPYDRK